MKAIREAEWWGDPIPQVRVSPHETLAAFAAASVTSDAPGVRGYAADGGAGA